MTTTIHLQKQPDFYTSEAECMKDKRIFINTNKRYPGYNQTHFTAGDESQFQEYRDTTNGVICETPIELKNNVFRKKSLEEEISWEKYKDLNPLAIDNTFNYMFQKFKKGIFVKIQDNQLRVFLPFSKNNFINEWGHLMKVSPKFNGDMYMFAKYIQSMDGTRYKISVDKFPNNWYANNCLVRYEFPINEGDTNITNMSDMLIELCKHRKIPDIEFFVNRRDFPLIKRNATEAYDHIFGSDVTLLSHNYEQYSPILSMVTTDKNADIPIPTGDDWARISSNEGKFFLPGCKSYPTIDDFNTPWDSRKSIAVFRGASTGCGVTIDTNQRLKLAYLSATQDKNNVLLDAGIVKWNLRPRKLNGEEYLQTINVPEMNKRGLNLVSFLSPLQQSEYKYIVHVDGHVSAFRLSLEMCMGSCILIVDSKYKLWFRNMIKPFVHYVPVKADLSDLMNQIKWCRENDAKCEEIANNAMKFYLKYLQKDGVLDYLQKLFIDLKKEIGTYLYNVDSPLQNQINIERKLALTYPLTDKTIKNIVAIPEQSLRSFGVLKALEWVVAMINDESNFLEFAKMEQQIFASKNSIVTKYKIGKISFVVKTTSDKIKEMENIHEAYIGIKSINTLIRYIPNFSYIFGVCNQTNVITEYIVGETLNVWIKSPKFNMKTFIFILVQLSFALAVAQKTCGFVHYDLTPWNIVLQEVKEAVSFDYVIDSNNVYRIETNIIPVIIDYGKSHVIHENKHYGFVNMFKISTIQDIISLLLTSINEIISINLSDEDQKHIITLSNFLSNTGYRKYPFRKIPDVSYFVKKEKKYNVMISSNKHELENKTPLDFISYIKTHFKYNFYKKVALPEFRLNKGNPRQVFDFMLASNIKEKAISFLDVFDRVIKCGFEYPVESFFGHYFVQIIGDNITTVYEIMLKYLSDSNIDSKMYKERYNKAIQKLTIKYSEIGVETGGVETDIKYSLNTIAQYSESTFLVPETILDLLEQSKDIKESDYINAIELKNVAESILLNNGIFKLSDDMKKYYTNNKFSSILNMNEVRVKNELSKIVTLRETSKEIFTKNLENLEKNRCNIVKNYKKIYKKIIKN